MNKRDYTGYVNPKLNDSNKIFTREEIAKMPRAEFAANEKAIDYQLGTIGIPSENDLQESSGVVHVRAYTKGDGTDVREHYRSAPNRQSNGWGMGVEGDENENNDDNTQDNNSENKIPTVYKGGIEKNVYKNNDGVMLPEPPDEQEEPQPDPQPEPPPEPDPQPTNEDEEQNISELKEIADLAKQIAQSMNSLKQIASNKADKQNLSLPVSSKYSGAINRHSNQIELSKTNLKRAINKSKISLQKQGNELTKLVDEAVNTTNQSKYGQLMQKINAKKQALSKHSQALNSVESLIQNGDYQGISDGYGSLNTGGSNSTYNPANQVGSKTLQGYISRYNDELPNTFTPQRNINPYIETYKNILNDSWFNPIDFTRRMVLNKVTDKFTGANLTTNEFMRHSIEGLKDISYTPECRIMKDFAEKYSAILRQDQYLLNEAKKLIDSGWKAIEYSPDSKVARQIVQSKEFRDFIKTNWDKIKAGQLTKGVLIEFKSNPDLAYSIGHATILHAKINKNGTFTSVIYDKYDFRKFKINWNDFNDLKNNFDVKGNPAQVKLPDVQKEIGEFWQKNKVPIQNNIALELQKSGLIKNYFVIIYIEIPLKDCTGIK